MRLGIGSYTFTWAAGVPGHPPARPLTPRQLLQARRTHAFQTHEQRRHARQEVLDRAAGEGVLACAARQPSSQPEAVRSSAGTAVSANANAIG